MRSRVLSANPSQVFPQERIMGVSAFTVVNTDITGTTFADYTLLSLSNGPGVVHSLNFDQNGQTGATATIEVFFYTFTIDGLTSVYLPSSGASGSVEYMGGDTANPLIGLTLNIPFRKSIEIKAYCRASAAITLKFKTTYSLSDQGPSVLYLRDGLVFRDSPSFYDGLFKGSGWQVVGLRDLDLAAGTYTPVNLTGRGITTGYMYSSYYAGIRINKITITLDGNKIMERRFAFAQGQNGFYFGPMLFRTSLVIQHINSSTEMFWSGLLYCLGE